MQVLKPTCPKYIIESQKLQQSPSPPPSSSGDPNRWDFYDNWGKFEVSNGGRWFLSASGTSSQTNSEPVKQTYLKYVFESDKPNQWVLYDAWGKFEVLNGGKWASLFFEALPIRNLKLERPISNVFKVKFVNYEKMYYPKNILCAGKMLYQYNWVVPYEKSVYCQVAETESIIILKRSIGMISRESLIKFLHLIGCNLIKLVNLSKQSGCSVVKDVFYARDHVSYPQFFNQKRLLFYAELNKQSNVRILKQLGSFLQWFEISKWVQRSAWWQVAILVQLRPLVRWSYIMQWSSRSIWRGLGVV